MGDRLGKIGVGNKAGAGDLLALSAIWTQHVWIFWVNTNNPHLPGWMPWQTIYLVISVCMVAVGIAAVRSAPKLNALAGKADVPLALLGLTGTAAVLASSFVGQDLSWVLALLGMIACGAAFGWANLRWGEFYSKLDIKQAIAFLFTGGILAALVKTALFFMPQFLSGTIACALPLASWYWCRRAVRTIERPDVNPATKSKPAVFYPRQALWALWKVALVFAVFSFANSSMLALLDPSQSVGSAPVFLAERALEALLCALVLLLVFQFGRSFDFAQLWKVVLLILATDFLVNIVHPGSPIQTLFAGVSLNFIVLFVWLVLADISRHSDLHPFSIFGVGWSCYTLPFFIGSVVVGALGFTSMSVGYFGALLYLVGVTAAFSLDVRDQDTKRIFHDLSGASDISDFDDIDSRCRSVAKERGLTARELEVMQMLCKGRSKAFIAETLYVTENTVKGHAKRLYAKLGVHSREELQRLIDIE